MSKNVAREKMKDVIEIYRIRAHRTHTKLEIVMPSKPYWPSTAINSRCMVISTHILLSVAFFFSEIDVDQENRLSQDEGAIDRVTRESKNEGNPKGVKSINTTSTPSDSDVVLNANVDAMLLYNEPCAYCNKVTGKYDRHCVYV